MSFSCYIHQDTRKIRKDGTYPLIIRVSVIRKTFSFKTDININQADWDAKNHKIKTSSKSIDNVTRANKFLTHCLTSTQKVLFEHSEKGTLTSTPLPEIRKEITTIVFGDTKNITLQSLIQEHIETMNKQKRYGNARTYAELEVFLNKYCGTSKIPVTHISFKWLSKLETEYLANGNSLNGLGVRLRALRALINYNRKLGTIDSTFNPFDNYTIKSQKTRKRALTKADFDKLLNADTSDFTIPMLRGRKMFLISYYLLGISYHDLAMLKLSNIVEGKVQYRRAKTKRLYSIKISKPLAELLPDFISGKDSDDYLFPIAKKGFAEDVQSNRIKNSIGRYNKCLKKIAVHVGIEPKSMSSYVSRHSVATHAREIANIDIPIISQMLGHNDVGTTAVYLASIQDSVIDDAVDAMFG